MTEATVVIPAYNEAGRIQDTVETIPEEYPVLVVDDGSTDGTTKEARNGGATVLEQDANQGYVSALKVGFRAVSTKIVVTFDADGEHRPGDISKLVEPISNGNADLVLGARRTIPRPSERLLNRLARLQVDLTDTGTGLRGIRRSLAIDLELDTACTCGTLVLEAAHKGARICEVTIETQSIQKPRNIAWKHGIQFVHVLRYLLL